MAPRTIEVTQKLPAAGPLPPGEVSIKDVAAALGVSTETIRRWVTSGKVKARRVHTGARGREGWRYVLSTAEFTKLREKLRSAA